MADPVLLVWRETQKGPAKCEVWFGDHTHGFKPIPTLARHVLTDEQAWKFEHGAMSLGDLVRIYPPPEVPDRHVFP